MARVFFLFYWCCYLECLQKKIDILAVLRSSLEELTFKFVSSHAVDRMLKTPGEIWPFQARLGIVTALLKYLMVQCITSSPVE